MKHSEVALVARSALDYIDALPKDVVAALPAMPGFDRDWAENVLAGGVPDEVLEQAAPIDRSFMMNMSGVERQMTDYTKEQLITQANIMRESAEKMADWDGQPGARARASLAVIEIALAALTGELMREALDDCSALMDTDHVMDSRCISYDDAELMTSGATALHDALFRWEVK